MRPNRSHPDDKPKTEEYGKLRGQITLAKSTASAEIEAAAKLAVAKYLEGMDVKKVIVVPGRLVSIVVA